MNAQVHKKFAVLGAVLLVSLAGAPARAAPPHLFQKDQCTDCHFVPERPGTFLAAGAFRRDIDSLCVACHEQERLGVGHRVGMVPTMRVPREFPLDAAGRLTCASCHDPHATEGANRWQLRRPPGPALCTACHRNGLPAAEPPVIRFTFPPEGAVVASPEVVVAGTAGSLEIREVSLRTRLGAATTPLVRGGFAARVRLEPGKNVVTADGGHGPARLTLTYRPGAGATAWLPHLTSDLTQCATCHPGWESDGWFRSAPPGETCQGCHERLDGLPHGHRPSAIGECTACHDPHGMTAAVVAARPGASCEGCHDATGAARHLLAVAAGQGPAPETDCRGCHDPHQSTRPGLTTSARASLVLSLDLAAPEPAIATTDDGTAEIGMEGFTLASDPGRPRLPERIVTLAVPPGADAATARLRTVSSDVVELPGSHVVAPAPPAATWDEGRQFVDWGHGRRIKDGKDQAVYGADAPWPSATLALERRAALGGQPLVRVAFRPLQYHPAAGTLTLTRRIVAEVEFSPAKTAASARGAKGARAASARAASIEDLGVANRLRARSWNAPSRLPAAAGDAAGGGFERQAAQSLAAPEGADYLVVTTKALAAASGALADFAAHKAARQLVVRVVTEDDYGVTPAGPPRAQAIRAWLQAHAGALGARYLLLAGNPHPESGDVPMLRSWPRRGATLNTAYLDAPTDAFYADLSGSWDLDGDGYLGEFRDDGGSGGVDFVPELFVGRIPVYGGAVATLDEVLRKTIAYETGGGDLAWRRSVLLPMSFSDPSTDGAWLAEKMKAGYLAGRGFSPWTLYQLGGGGGKTSVFTPDAELTGGAVAARWGAVPYGVVVWWAHGSASRTLIGYSGAWDGELLASPTGALDDAAPAIVFQTACLNGYPESESNLGYNLLKRGAVATVAASRVSWYAIGQKDFRKSTTNAGLAYRFVSLLSAGESAGRALALVRGDPAVFHDTDTAWMNLMDFNLYGDPSVALFRGPVLAASPGAVSLLAAEGETAPVSAAVALSAVGTTVDVSGSADAAWIAAAPLEAQTPATLTVSALPAGLAAGTHAGTVTLASTAAGNGPVAVPVTLTVTRPGRVAGSVVDPTGAPLPGATVSLRGVRERTTTTDAAGRYAFETLPPGGYTAAVSGTGFVFPKATQTGTLAEGEELRLRFVAQSYLIRGRVNGPGGVPIPKAAVQLRDGSGVLLRQVLTDAGGNYVIRRLGPGDYQVRARLKPWRFTPATLPATITDASLADRNFAGTR